MPTQEIPYIDAIPVCHRLFTVHEHLLFYQSTGTNSGDFLKNTWLPCLGFPGPLNPYNVLKDFMLTEAHQAFDKGTLLVGKCPEEWIIKISFLWRDKKLPPDLEAFIDDDLKALYETHQSIDFDAFVERMGYIKTACISASLGGGVWESPFGHALKQKLEKAYPEQMSTSLILGQRFSAPSYGKVYTSLNRGFRSRGAAFSSDITSLNEPEKPSKPTI